jgi:hypothetical protein
MAYHGMKKEDIEDTSMERLWPSARPAKAWNPFGQLPPPQRGGGDGAAGDDRAAGDEGAIVTQMWPCNSNNLPSESCFAPRAAKIEQRTVLA